MMTEKYYKMAGLELSVRMPKDRMYDDDRHLAHFRVDSVENPHQFTFEVVEDLPAPCGAELMKEPTFRVYSQGEGTVRYIGPVAVSWEDAHMRAEHQGRIHSVLLKASQFPDRIGMTTVLNALEAEHLMVWENALIFHCAYIEADGKAIVFTAPSGTGKTTQAELWKEYRGAQIMNGDRAALWLDGGQACAAGIPFSGSSVYCQNRTLPLAAVVYLQQAPVTEICRLRGARAFARIWEGCCVNTWDKEDVWKASALVEELVGKVPVYLLACTPDESAVIALERMLGEKD